MMPTHSEVIHDQKEKVGPRIMPPSSGIIGESAALFTDMTETILDALDKQVNLSTSSQHAKRSSPKEDQMDKMQKEKPQVSTQRKTILIYFYQLGKIIELLIDFVVTRTVCLQIIT